MSTGPTGGTTPTGAHQSVRQLVEQRETSIAKGKGSKLVNGQSTLPRGISQAPSTRLADRKTTTAPTAKPLVNQTARELQQYTNDYLKQNKLVESLQNQQEVLKLLPEVNQLLNKPDLPTEGLNFRIYFVGGNGQKISIIPPGELLKSDPKKAEVFRNELKAHLNQIEEYYTPHVKMKLQTDLQKATDKRGKIATAITDKGGEVPTISRKARVIYLGLEHLTAHPGEADFNPSQTSTKHQSPGIQPTGTGFQLVAEPAEEELLAEEELPGEEELLGEGISDMADDESDISSEIDEDDFDEMFNLDAELDEEELPDLPPPEDEDTLSPQPAPPEAPVPPPIKGAAKEPGQITGLNKKAELETIPAPLSPWGPTPTPMPAFTPAEEVHLQEYNKDGNAYIFLRRDVFEDLATKGNIASVNAGTTGLLVGLGGINGQFAKEIAHSKYYEAFHSAVLQQCKNNDGIYITPQSLLNREKPSLSACLVYPPNHLVQVQNGKSILDPEGAVFLDVFKENYPGGNPKNRAMIYVVPPKASSFSNKEAFLAAIQETATRVYLVQNEYNRLVDEKHPNFQDLEPLPVMRTCAFSSGYYLDNSLTKPTEVASAITAGLQEAQSLLQAEDQPNRIKEIQYEDGKQKLFSTSAKTNWY